MKKVIVALSAAALIATTPAVMAMGTSGKTHGHEMHLKKGHHGTSARASEQEMKKGSSNSAPGQTTGSNAKPTGSNTKR